MTMTPMTALLVEISALNTSNAVSMVRLSNVDEYEVCALNGVEWLPSAVSLSGLSVSWFDPEFQGRATGSQGALTFNANRINVIGYTWANRPVTIYSGNVGDPWSAYSVLYKGVIAEMGFDERGLGMARLKQDDGWLSNPVLNLSYAGTGGTEGPSSLKGTPKPFCLGTPKGVPGVQIDATNLVYQVHGYGSIQSIDVVYDGGARLTFSADYASYSALVSATVPRGRYATCLASGMIRLGTAPVYPIDIDVSGDNSTSASFIRRAGAAITRLAGLANAPSGSIDTTSMTSLDTANTATISHYISTQTTAGDLIQQIAGAANGTAVVSLAGQLCVSRAVVASPVVYFATDGGESAVPVGATDGGNCGNLTYRNLSAPYWRLTATAETTYRVLGPGEIAFTAELNDRGAWSSGTTYREGDQVTGSDLARYQYIATSPSSGNALSNTTYWQLIAAAPTISNISGAGALASQNSVDYSAVSGTKPPSNATYGADWNTSLANKPSDSLLLNSSQSFSLSANGTLTWNTGSGSFNVGQANLSGMGAGAMALINGLNSGNITTYIGAQAIPGALIGLAAIGEANIANAAVTNQKMGGPIYSDTWNGVIGPGGAGWYIGRDGTAYFNGPVFSRDQVASTTYYSVSGGGNSSAYAWQETGSWTIDVGVANSAWLASNGPLVANASFAGTINADPSYPPEVYWSVFVDLAPYTKWNSSGTLARLSLWTYNVQSYSGSITVNVYKVT